MREFMEMMMRVIGETLCFIEMEELYVSKFPVKGNGEVARLIADLQEGVWECCDECGIGVFYSYGKWDRLGYEHFNNGAFFCRACDDRLCEEEFGNEHRHGLFDRDAEFIEF